MPVREMTKIVEHEIHAIVLCSHFTTSRRSSVRLVFAEANWVRHFVGPLANFHFYPKVSQSCHHSHIKIGYRLRSQRYLPLLDTKQMVDEIEVDLKNSFAERNRRGREPARRHVESDVPGMIEPWSLRQSNFAEPITETSQTL
jgi:hypothetical protein